jgi:signal peptidase I
LIIETFLIETEFIFLEFNLCIIKMSKKNIFGMAKNIFRKVRYFLVEDDSWFSFIVTAILAFVFIKFIVYPGIGFLLGTSYPVVAVVSGSMEHDGSFDDWWQSSVTYPDANTQEDFYSKFGIDKSTFRSYSFKNGFNTGDIMVLKGIDAKKIRIGDVIVFRTTLKEPVIHRVVEIRENSDGSLLFRTKGDHNPTIYGFEETINDNQILGVAKLRIPFLGWVKLIFVKLLNLA